MKVQQEMKTKVQQERIVEKFVYIQPSWKRSSINENHERIKDSVKLKITASSFSSDFQ
jgi:hypothetical protein